MCHVVWHGLACTCCMCACPVYAALGEPAEEELDMLDRAPGLTPTYVRSLMLLLSMSHRCIHVDYA